MQVTVNGTKYEVAHTFPVLYQGWECDSQGYVVKKGNKHCLVLSDHGRLYFAKESELKSKIEEYESAIQASKEAISLIRK